MPDFDPYYKWLAIPPSEQPPHYYRLLGLALFEPDLDVISAAADRQMTHVRSYQNGAHSQASQKVLNELSQARLTLLRADTKAKYDAELRQRLSATLPRAKPLKMAAPLEASDSALPQGAAVLPLATNQPRPRPLPHPQPQQQAQPAPLPQPLPRPASPSPGIIRPQTMPAATQARPEPHTRVPAHDEQPAADQGPTPHERRRIKQRNAMIRSVVGVIFGGIAGTYIAGLILNFLGAPIPDGVRFLPGLRSKNVVVAKDGTPQETGGTITDNSNKKRPSNANSQTASGNPWDGVNPDPAISLPAGTHALSFVERNGRPLIRVKSLTGGATFDRELGKVTRIFGAVVENSGSRLSFTAKPGGFATFVLPIEAQQGCKIEAGNVYFDLDLGENEESLLQFVVSRDFNFSTWEKPTNLRRDFGAFPSRPFRESKRVGGDFSGAWDRQLFFVAALSVGAQAKPGATKLYLSASPGNLDVPFATIVIRQETTSGVGPTPPVVVSRDQSQGTREQLRRVDSGASGKLAYPESQLRDLRDAVREQLNLDGAQEWLLAASKTNNRDAACAMLLLAAEQATSSGDVVLASTAYSRLNQSYAHDFSAVETQALLSFARQPKPGLQPAAFASWGLDVLHRQSGTKQEANKELVQQVYEAAVESMDRDLVQRATLVVAGASL